MTNHGFVTIYKSPKGYKAVWSDRNGSANPYCWSLEWVLFRDLKIMTKEGRHEWALAKHKEIEAELHEIRATNPLSSRIQVVVARKTNPTGGLFG